MASIVLVENAPLDEEARRKAEIHGVNILTTDATAYEVAASLSNLL